MSDQSQTTEKAEVIGKAIYNPPQKYSSSVKIGSRTHVVMDEEGNPLGGKYNPCPIEMIIDGLVYSLPVGATYLFPDEVAFVLLERCPWLKDVTKKGGDYTPAPTREPTQAEAPLLFRAKKEAAKGRQVYALTGTGGRVKISPTGGTTGPVIPTSEPEGIEAEVEKDNPEEAS